MPEFLDSTQWADSWPDGLMKGQNELRDEFGFKILNTFYDLDSGIVDT
jgi:hypothetical protein